MALAVPALIAGALWLLIGHGFANYDTLYALVWGEQVWRGETPSYEVTLAPTPHPLANLVGIVLAPLPDGVAEALVVAGAFLSLGALGWVVHRLGAEWFGAAGGVAAAILLLTREPVLSFGVRAYVDIPYLALVLGALLVEARRPRAGTPVLVLLGLAGLIRPEAWLFAGAYVLWLWRAGRPPLGLFALAAAAPLVWAISDLLVTGDALHSLTGTRDTAEVLGRKTGLDDVPGTLPRRLGEILREPGLLGAAGGGLLALAWGPRRTRLGAAAGVLAVVAFCVLAAAGLPIITRYLLGTAAILAVFFGAGVGGWIREERDGSRRRAWMAFALVAVAAFAAFAPSQLDRLERLDRAIARQEAIRDDLYDIVERAPCTPVAVPNHRAVPLVALRLDVAPQQVVSAQVRRISSGTFLQPANARVERDFILDRNDPHPLDAEPPPGFRQVASNGSWRMFARC